MGIAMVYPESLRESRIDVLAAFQAGIRELKQTDDDRERQGEKRHGWGQADVLRA